LAGAPERCRRRISLYGVSISKYLERKAILHTRHTGDSEIERGLVAVVVGVKEW
jgi:hypothetical protein